MKDELDYLDQEIERAMSLAIAESEGDVLAREVTHYANEDPAEKEHRLFQVRLREQQLSTQEQRFEADRHNLTELDQLERQRRLKELELRQQLTSQKRVVGNVVGTVLPPSLDYNYRHMRDLMLFKRSGPRKLGSEAKMKKKPQNSGKMSLDILKFGKGKSKISEVTSVLEKNSWKEARFVLCDGGQRLLYYVKSNGSRASSVGDIFRTSVPAQSNNHICDDDEDRLSADKIIKDKKRSVVVEDVGLISLVYVKATDPPLKRYETLDQKTGKFRLFTKEETITFKPMSKQKGMKWIQGICEAIERLPKQISSDAVVNEHPITYQDLKKQRIQMEEISLFGQATWKTFVLRDGTLYCFKDGGDLEWIMFLWGATIGEGGRKGASKKSEIKLVGRFPNNKTVSLRASDDIATITFYTL